MRNYEEQNSFHKLYKKSLPRDSNIISSYDFLKVKYDGDEQNLS